MNSSSVKRHRGGTRDAPFSRVAMKGRPVAIEVSTATAVGHDNADCNFASVARNATPRVNHPFLLVGEHDPHAPRPGRSTSLHLNAPRGGCTRRKTPRVLPCRRDASNICLLACTRRNSISNAMRILRDAWRLSFNITTARYFLHVGERCFHIHIRDRGCMPCRVLRRFEFESILGESYK